MSLQPAPKFSVIIPARNEEAYLPRCLAAIKRAAVLVEDQVETVVVLNRCTDRTAEIAQEFGCRIVSEDAKNLAVIRNAGARAAAGDILVTIDADSTMSENMLQKISQTMQRADVIGGGVLMLPERWSPGIFLSGVCLLPIALRYWISGGLFFCRREDFWAIEGFNPAKKTAEDIDFAKRLKYYGKSKQQRFVVLFSAYIVTSCRKFDSFGDWYLLKNPQLFREILRGDNQDVADKVWYDFPR